MSYVQSFSFTPPPRNDAVPWTEVEVWESDDATRIGTYVMIDTISIPIDTSPHSPLVADVTTSSAVFAEGWYKGRFKDGAGNYSNFTLPVWAPSAPFGAPPDPDTVADYTKMHLGGDNWDVLFTATNYGSSYIALAIETVKWRVMATPVLADAESDLDPKLLDYLGILSALELLSAVRSAWASKTITRSVGNDPVEITRYTDRSKGIDDLRDDLMLRLPNIQAAAVPLLDQPVAGVGSRPTIDELDDYKVTDDPRCFPPASTFPYDRDDLLVFRQRWY